MNQLNWKHSIARFLTAQTISLFGSSLVQYAIVWYITLTTSSGKMLTISTMCGFLPQIVISLFAGVWIDRYDRKKMIMLSDSAIALSTLLLAAAFLSGHKSVWFLFAALVVRSAGTGIQTPAVNAMIPQIVPKPYLMKVNGLNSTLSSMMMFLSPAASGAVLSVAPLEAALFIDVLTAVIGVGITATIHAEPYEKRCLPGTAGLEEIRDGFRYLKDNQLIKRLLLFQITILFLVSPSAFLTPLMVSRTFGSEVWRLTVSEMTYSLGMVLGGILIASWGGFKKRMNTTLAAGAVYGLIMIGLGNAGVFLLYLLFNTAIGITSLCYNAPVTVTIQEKVSPGMQGRIFSFMQIATSCALPLGMLVFGPLADLVPVQYLLNSAGLMILIICCIVWKANGFSVESATENIEQPL